MSYADLIEDMTLSTLVFKGLSVPVQDPVTFKVTYTDATVLTTTGLLTNLTVGEKVARQQLQDATTHKLVLDDITENRVITRLLTVVVDGVTYQITGVKLPKISDSWITVYIKE